MLYFEDVTVGSVVHRLEKPPISRVQLVKYAGASGDFNPLHTDDRVGQAAGIGGVIAHGMLVMGFAGQAITQYLPQSALQTFAVRFVGMTRPEESIVVTLQAREKSVVREGFGEISFDVTAMSATTGDVKLKGTCKATLPCKNAG